MTETLADLMRLAQKLTSPEDQIAGVRVRFVRNADGSLSMQTVRNDPPGRLGIVIDGVAEEVTDRPALPKPEGP